VPEKEKSVPVESSKPSLVMAFRMTKRIATSLVDIENFEDIENFSILRKRASGQGRKGLHCEDCQNDHLGMKLYRFTCTLFDCRNKIVCGTCRHRIEEIAEEKRCDEEYGKRQVFTEHNFPSSCYVVSSVKPATSVAIIESQVQEVACIPVLDWSKYPVRLHIPQPRKCEEEKLVAAINLGFARGGDKLEFASILRSFRSKGFENKKRSSGKFTTSKNIPVFRLETSNRFQSGDVSIENLGGVSPFIGFVPERRVRKTNVKNDRFAHWMEANLLRKKIQHTLKQKRIVRSSNRHELTISSRYEDLKTFVWKHFGRVSTEGYFRASVVDVSSRFNCPSRPFSLFWENGKVSLLEGGQGKGISVYVNSRIFAHLGDEGASRPLSPTSSISSRMDELHRRLSSGPAVIDASRLWGTDEQNTQIQFNQQVINLSSSIRPRREWDSSEVIQKIWNILSFSPTYMNAVTCFFVALTWKQRYNCPLNEIHINFNRSTKQIERMDVDTEISTGGRLMFYVDNRPLYHCGVSLKENLWELVARKMIRDKIGLNFSELPVLSDVLVFNPWFTHRFLGFRFAIQVGDDRIFARGYDFIRPDTRPGQEGFISVRQHVDFWKIADGERLVLTPKGMAKVFWRKPKFEKWRSVIARSIGMKLSAAESYFKTFSNDDTQPDVVVAKQSDDPYTQKRKERKSVKFVEIPVLVKTKYRDFAVQTELSQSKIITTTPKSHGSSSSLPKVVLPPPPELPRPQNPTVSLPVVGKEEVYKCVPAFTFTLNGHEALIRAGKEGQSHRSVFVKEYPDWPNRVSTDAFKAIRNDFCQEPGQYQDFDRQYKNTTTQETLMGDHIVVHFKKQGEARKINFKSRSSSSLDEAIKLRRRSLEEAEKDFKAPRSFKKARDSTQSDIEENPGPASSFKRPSRPSKKIQRESDEQLIAFHPTPGRGDDSPTGSYVSTNTGSLLVENFRLQEASPETTKPEQDPDLILSPDKLSRHYRSKSEPNLRLDDPKTGEFIEFSFDNPIKQFRRPRDSSMSDIEEHPGPITSRGKDKVITTPGTASEIGESSDIMTRGRSQSPHHSLRNRSRSRSIGASIRSVFTNVEDEAKVSVHLGFNAHIVKKYNPPEQTWFEKKYDHAYVVGHLPKDNLWSAQSPLPLWSANFFCESQRVMDKTNWSKHRFDHTKVADVVSFINTFFQTQSETVVDSYTMVALATGLKTRYACPADKMGHAIMIKPETKEIIYYYTANPDSETENRLWWGMNGYHMVHGGKRLNQFRFVRERANRDLARYYKTRETDPYLWTDEEVLAAEAKRGGESTGFVTPHCESPTQSNRPCFKCPPCRSYKLALDLETWIIWFYFLICSVVTVVTSFYSSFFWPDFDESDHFDGLTEGHTEIPESKEQSDIENTLLVAAFGTRGDQVPVKYFARLAAKFGVKTHFHTYHSMSLEEIQQLKEGNMFSLLPSYLKLSYATCLGYKKVFVPHIEVDRSLGLTYNLSPGPKWINPIKYTETNARLSLFNKLQVFWATRLASVFSPDVRIGALSGCQLPRSHDGYRLLKRKHNFKTGAVGWLSGSASEDVIPSSIRETCIQVPDGDHLQTMRRFDKIHMHGGAGTVQTALAAGAMVEIHDKLIDRDYLQVPIPFDFKQPSISVYMGWLICSGFKVDALLEVKCIWVLSYLFRQLPRYVFHTAVWAAKLYTIGTYLWENWSLILLLFFSVNMIFWKILFNTVSISTLARVSLNIALEFPAVCLVNSKTRYVALMICSRYLVTHGLQDFANKRMQTMELVFEPIEREGFKFWFPFGHWSLRDKRTGLFYEGKFENTSRQALGDPFLLKEIRRDFAPGARVFPCPFNPAVAKKMAQSKSVAPYSGVHNCATMSLRLTSTRSLTWTLILTPIVATLTVVYFFPDYLIGFCKFLWPHKDVRETWPYQALAFAAGIEQIPLEPLEVTDEEQLITGVDDPPTPFSLVNPDGFKSLVEEIVVIKRNIELLNLDTIDSDDLQEVAERALDHELLSVEIPTDSMLQVQKIPPYVKYTWAEIVEGIHHAISFLRHNPFIDAFVSWLKGLAGSLLEFSAPLLEIMGYLLSLAHGYSKMAFQRVFEWVCHLMDYMWGLEASTRVKTVWGLTGLHRTGLLGAKARLAASIAFSGYTGRSDFQSDYQRFCDSISETGKKVGATHTSKLGGPQRRPVRYSKPLMTKEQAEIMGFKEGEYATDEIYSARVQEYSDEGTPQGGDGVFLADKFPELISKSQHRYEPKYAELSSDDRRIAEEVAIALIEQYPTVFKDCDIITPGSVYNYIKKKYSPGTPFINDKTFKSRQAMFDAGYDKVIKRRGIEQLESGEYPVQFYHAFVKSQVVDIRKCLPVGAGGKGKDVRTVVSQDLFSYMVDQVAQIERNKRDIWSVYGAGIGMPLNQTMELVFNRMMDDRKERGGYYVEADATAFDSYCDRILFEVNANLWKYGFKDHPSGNGKNIASILKASYDSRQNCWIIGVTEPEYPNMTVCVPDKDTKAILANKSSNVALLSDFVDFNIFQKLSTKDKLDYVHNLKVPEGLTLVTWDPKYRPFKSGWMGTFEYGDINEARKRFFEHQTWIYDPSNQKDLVRDILAIANTDKRLLSNVHPKNRGGSTGGSDTSSVNTHAFKAGVIIAWMKTTGRSAKEFFTYNTLYNTSDDTIWQSGGTFGLKTPEQIQIFQRHAADVGIHLTLNFSKSIDKIEYLSKFVRNPTPEDSETLQMWRKVKIKNLRHRYERLGIELPNDALSVFNNPRKMVVQDPVAILQRRINFRYYQSSVRTWRYTSAQRGAGQAMVTAFQPTLYAKFAKEWCEDVNHLLDRENIHRKYVLRDGQFGLMEVQNIDPRSTIQALSPRQKAFLEWLKQNNYPSYYRVIDIHMNVKKVDPEAHSRFLRKLEKGWRGWEQVLRESVDGLFAFTDMIPDEWSKKFQPGIEMLYAEQPFYTKNHHVERFLMLRLLEESKPEDITFHDFSGRVKESPYAACCDQYHFWEKWQQEDFKKQLLQEDTVKIQGLVMWITAFYWILSYFEWAIMGTTIGIFYKLYLWTFIGQSKIYGILGTLYWHSAGRSSREISQMMPRDMYMVSKRFCSFLADFIPEELGYMMLIPSKLIDMLPPFLEAVGKFWYVAGEVKQQPTINSSKENPWSTYADEYIDHLRKSPTKRAYVAAKTSTGKSTMWIAALWAARNRKQVRKIWLVEPRKLLRDNTHIPFNIPTQILKAGVRADPTVSIYKATYGHMISRLFEIDNEKDIVLFDEFHEELGEMIRLLSDCKAPVFLLSATPVEVPSIINSPFLTPKIDRRHPITVYRVDDTMGVVEMFQEAANRHPEFMDRVLIIVPTHKMCEMVKSGLEYLKVDVTILSSRQRVVPEKGCIVGTPYVETGVDIQPPVNGVIDCGKTNVIHKGIHQYPFPWTSKDTNNQRIGRAGRLKPGFVIQPKSAGTGERTVTYPSPNMFQHESVAKHFRVPVLTSVEAPVVQEFPFLHVNYAVLKTRQIQRSVVTIHAIALSGVIQENWEEFYTKLLLGKSLGEDYEQLTRVFNKSTWKRANLLPYVQAMYWLSTPRAVKYSIEGKDRWCKPLSPIDGQWIELEDSPTKRLHIKEEKSLVEPKIAKLQKQLDKLTSALLSRAKTQGDVELPKLIEALA
jgi:hypothetical protein